MRVAIFSGNYNYIKEGANQALNHLVRHLEGSRGHQVRIYSPVTATPAFEPAGTLVPVPSVPLPVRGEFRLALGLPARVRRDLRSFAPDLVHVSAPDILNVRAQTFARRHGAAVVASLHTRFETYLDYYRLGWARPLVEAHLRRFYRRSDHVLAPTAALVAEMRALRRDDRVSLWSRGVDRELFNPARRDESWRRAQGFAPEDVVVLFFGRLVLEKGVDDYVRVMQSLRAGGETVKPLILGAGPAAERLRGLEGAVFTGHLQGTELARAVASADVLLSPSRTEAFGNVVLEAMASGLAIVNADAPSARQLIADGRTGLLCQSDVEAYVGAVASLARSPERRRALAAAAVEVSADYSWHSASESVARAYESVMGRRDNEHPSSWRPSNNISRGSL